MRSTSTLGRRAFLGLAAATGAALAGLPLATPSAASPGGGVWRVDAFRPLVGQRFAVLGGGHLRLVEVLDRRRKGVAAETFLLLFEPQGVRSDNSLLRLTHPALGTVPLGVTSVGRRGRLQAVVDQRRAPLPSKEH